MTLDKNEIHRLVGELLKAIQDGEPDSLLSFGVNPAIYEEVIEELDRSGENISDLTIPPYETAFTPDLTGRIPLDGYELDSFPQTTRIACQLWTGKEKTDLTLISDYSKKQEGGASLTFRLLETQ